MKLRNLHWIVPALLMSIVPYAAKAEEPSYWHSKDRVQYQRDISRKSDFKLFVETEAQAFALTAACSVSSVTTLMPGVFSLFPVFPAILNDVSDAKGGVTDSMGVVLNGLTDLVWMAADYLPDGSLEDGPFYKEPFQFAREANAATRKVHDVFFSENSACARAYFRLVDISREIDRRKLPAQARNDGYCRGPGMEGGGDMVGEAGRGHATRAD